MAKTIYSSLRRGVSEGYVELSNLQVGVTAQKLRHAWRHHDLPTRQRQLAERQLRQYREGMKNPAFDALIECLQPLALSGATLLEVGCSSGYYSEVLADRAVPVIYRGCDYSESFIAMARRCYPTVPFDVADATRLPYPDNSFDIVVSGCCILHIPEFRDAVREAARTARRYVVFHRTPVLASEPTRYFTKNAYGVRTLEIHFNEDELVRLFSSSGLSIIDMRTLDANWHNGDAAMTRTYLCRKDV